MELFSFRWTWACKCGDIYLRTSLIFCAVEATVSRDLMNRSHTGESLFDPSVDNDSTIFFIWLIEYNDCKSSVGTGPAEKVTVAATFKHRVIFPDTRDLMGSWRSICTSIENVFRIVLKRIIGTICSLRCLGMSQKSRVASPMTWSCAVLCLQYNFKVKREDWFAVLES